MHNLLSFQIKNYFPFQPEIQLNTNSYIEYKPYHYSENKDIALFYQFKTNDSCRTTLSLIPDGCFDILFCCNQKNPSSFLWTSPIERRKQPTLQKNSVYFGIRFFPEQGLIKLNYPMKELLDKQIPLLDVISLDSSIIERISSKESFLERIRLFEDFIQIADFHVNNNQKIVDFAIKKIYSCNGIINIKALSDHLGYSEQYIRRKFENYIGFSPKQFSQIVRFQNSLDGYLLEENSELLDIIHDNGYYDQAHFINGFKKLMNITPKQYKKRFMDINFNEASLKPN
ncbi:helix-turn-helix transcriptional regulator [Niallia nealsonii]|uniref:AraC family transcriptional regulator n=1 Tax=Niallia nealsonii TaxID=115979 RepID=A0A2N0Z5F3_9BACI|nr:helix-turn-helix transcriptional regulator [Niallia nealsonii]PKG24732.1 AraC family transcriptional regulator [Niallia nealsonii]